MDATTGTPTTDTDPGEDPTLDLSTGLTRGDLHRAALAVCAAATDVDDARDLLEALGLLTALREPSRLAG